ncbi:hypothetical protein PQX77_007340 [Marasmius sp. AFHP31]|nr:hypothetical protein PQX77_007340 [Marasmius sp. AFHP31]
MSSNFRNAQHTTIGDCANFQNVAGNSTITYNNYHNSERRDLITVNGRTVRKVIDGDIIFRRHLWSRVLSIQIKPEGTSTESQVVKVRKTSRVAEIFGSPGTFTATTFEPVDEKDRDEFVKIVKNILEAVMCRRSAFLTQVFAVANSNELTMIFHDELVNAGEVSGRYWKDCVVFYYLVYTLVAAIGSLRDDETVTFPVAKRLDIWWFNLKSLTWNYDPASVLLNPPSEEDLRPFYNPLISLRQDTLPHLNINEIVVCVENNFGDVLHLIATSTRWRYCSLSDFTHHGLLTFGAVVDLNKREILAHFPSASSLEWFCMSNHLDVEASHCSSSWQVDLALCETGDVRVTLDFGWRILEKDRTQLRCAFLCQSLRFCDDSDDAEDVVYVNQVGFRLTGHFLDDPATHSTPAYLFVQPLPTKFLNNMHCVHYPFPENLYYWSHDPQGGSAIAEEDWEKCGIPKLTVGEWIGTCWREYEYTCVRDCLCSRAYELDGRQYARDHGYPELVLGDPHEPVRIEELDHPNSEPENSPSPARLATSSTSSLARAPVKCDTAHEDSPTLSETGPVTHWARPGFLNSWYNFVAQADALDFSVAAC